MKFRGVAAMIEIAWAGQLGHSGDADEDLEDGRGEHERRGADREETGRLEAGVPAARAECPVTVPPEVVGDGHREGERRGHQVMEVEELHTHGEHAQVHHIPGRSDRTELHQLHPVVRLRQAGPQPQVHRMGAVGDSLSRLVGHAGNGTPKCSSTSGVTSARDHCSRSGASTPHRSSTPSESSRWSDPWLPPPTWSAPPQSTNS